MHRLSFLLVVLLTLGAGLSADVSAQASKGTKWALLVGVGDYESPEVSDLRYTVRDVTAVAQALVEHVGFRREHLTLMTTGPGSDARPTDVDLLERLDLLAKKVKPEDTFVFYFSGHGFTRENRHFLATVNIRPSTVETLERTSVSLEMLRTKMSRIQARSAVFIIDACRNDPETGKGDRDNLLTEALARDLKRVAAGSGSASAVLFACAEGERAYEWPEKQHGVFTYHLVAGLEGRATDVVGRITLNSLGSYVQKQVPATDYLLLQNRKQTPIFEQVGAAQEIVLRDALPMVAGTDPAGAGAPGKNGRTFRSLYNGRDFTGWRPPRTTWRHADGVLTGIGAEGVNATDGEWLVTDREYGDFELRLEYRIESGANSGVALRYPGHGDAWQTGFEVQICDDDLPVSAGLPKDFALEHLPRWLTGAIGDASPPAARPALPAGSWNRLVVRCVGYRLQVWLNGTQIQNADCRQLSTIGGQSLASRPLRGFIGLQRQRRRVEFRNIEILEL